MVDNIWKKAEKNIVIHKEGINATESCLDRHAKENPNKTALVFENEEGNIEIYSYQKLLEETNRFANFLDALKVKKRARVFIFLPKLPDMYIALLGTIRHGSIAAPLFEAFQSDGLELRLTRGEADVLVTNQELFSRIPKNIKEMVKSLKEIIIVDSPEYKEHIKDMRNSFNSVLLKKDETMFMIFTSSTAGTPVAGVEIPHQGIIQQDMTARIVLDLKEKDNYWCTAHPAWITGMVYGILAPLSIGCTIFVIEGRFDSKKWIEFIKKNKISVIYTAPTALRMLKPEITKKDLSGVRNICSVGEALTGTIFEHYKKLGVEINDSYWQSETGAMVIANWPTLAKKPGSLGKPLPGIKAKIDNGMIKIKPGWPAMMSGIYKHDKMYKEYFSKGWFKTNDLAKLDKQGYFYFEARQDDIIKTSGERVSPIEIESILLKHKSVKEAAVIGIPDEMKGSVLKAFVVLTDNIKADDKLKEELAQFVKKNYAGHAYPKEIEFLDKLPKTNSGKIIRMELRKPYEKK